MPKSKPMKKLFAILFLGASFLGYAQKSTQALHEHTRPDLMR